MHIRRITITLPPRLRGRAAEEARRIAQAAAENLGHEAPRRISVEAPGGADAAGAVGRRLAVLTKGAR